MSEHETKVVVYCKICDCYITILFSKEEFLENATINGGLVSGTFLHKPENKMPHALLIYFDTNFNHRGTVCSKLVTANNIYVSQKKK